jgi:hypothetical protein
MKENGDDEDIFVTEGKRKENFLFIRKVAEEKGDEHLRHQRRNVL